MFKNPFSFSGRIRRLEYGLSYLIFIASFFLIGVITEIIPEAESLIVLIILPSYWFLIAQGSKRCHDLGNSGFFQLIPFYGLFMLFEEGNYGVNKYGYNPKEIDAPIVKREPFKLRISLPPGKSNINILSEILCFVLLNTLLIQLSNNYVEKEFFSFLCIFISILVCFFLMLLFANKKEALPEFNSYLFRQRLAYSAILSISIYLYNLTFNYTSFQLEDISYAIFLALVILGVTYLPFLIYKSIFKKRKEEVVYEN
ncbi:DUF805 domain-containing protein [uncultured Aquimarina sp.]|uniref:DUF805 domain-containing protein n=1 Tax=uncultured Aquimarina sp. TaxID=575652 RepID=UPI002630127F|nr:DUF805 domain-containing protein [uncultured Aquimarina sp.]